MRRNNDVHYVGEEDKFINMLKRGNGEFLNYEKMQVINNNGAKISNQINVVGKFPSELPVLLDFGKEDCKYKITYLDKEYSTIIENILKTGFEYEDPNRKGVTRKQIPFATISASGKGVFEDGVISIRKSPFKSTVAELVLFLQGVTDLREFEKAGCKWWRRDWSNFVKRRFDTDDFEEYKQRPEVQEFLSEGDYEERLEYSKKVFYNMGYIYPHYYMESYKVFDNFKENPFRTDLIVNSWDINKNHPKTCTLVACHFNYQFVKTRDGFGIVWSQR